MGLEIGVSPLPACQADLDENMRRAGRAGECSFARSAASVAGGRGRSFLADMTEDEERMTRPAPRTVSDAFVAGTVAAVVSGVPSSVWAVATGRSLTEGALAAGSLMLPREQRPAVLLAAAVPVHLMLSLGWAFVMTATLPSRRTLGWATLAGLGIAALDLGVIGRRLPRIRALPLRPQVADHLAYGATVGIVLDLRRR